MLGPVFWLELLTSARRSRYFAVRTFYAVVLLATLVVSCSVSSFVSMGAQQANLANGFFSAFVYVQLTMVLVLVPAVVSATVAQEHERRTIEYLLTSQLTTPEIVLGKLVARVLHALFMLASGIPVVAIATLLGGITPATIWTTSCATALVLVATAAMSMAMSVYTRRTWQAVVKAYVGLLVLLFGLPFISILIMDGFSGGWWNWLAISIELNPYAVITGLLYSWQAQPPMSSRDLLIEMAVVYGGFALLCTAASLWGLRRTYRRSTAITVARKWWTPPRFRPKLGSHAMLWKELIVERSTLGIGWLGKVVMLLLVAGVLYMNIDVLRSQPDSYFETTLMMGVSISLLSLLLIAARAATSITSERERDCWVMLLTTRLTPTEIVVGKAFGAFYGARGIVLLSFALWAACLIADFREKLTVVATAVTYLVLAVWAAMLGMVFSLRCRTSVRALVSTLGTLIFIGGGYLFCCCSLAGMLVYTRASFYMLVLSPAIPFLAYYPSMAFSFAQRAQPRGDEDGYFLLAYLVGVSGYVLGSILLHAYAVQRFDAINGRITPPLIAHEPPEIEESQAVDLHEAADHQESA